jgi:hypothetical protein
VYIPYCTKKSSHNTQNNKQKIWMIRRKFETKV